MRVRPKQRLRDSRPTSEEAVIFTILEKIYGPAQKIASKTAAELEKRNAQLHDAVPGLVACLPLANQGFTCSTKPMTYLWPHPQIQDDIAMFIEDYRALETEYSNVGAFLRRTLHLHIDDIQAVLPRNLFVSVKKEISFFATGEKMRPDELELFLQINIKPLTNLQVRIANNMLEVI